MHAKISKRKKKKAIRFKKRKAESMLDANIMPRRKKEKEKKKKKKAILTQTIKEKHYNNIKARAPLIASAVKFVGCFCHGSRFFVFFEADSAEQCGHR